MVYHQNPLYKVWYIINVYIYILVYHQCSHCMILNAYSIRAYMGIPHVQPHALAAAIEQMAISGMLNLDGTVAVLDPAKNLSATELPATLLYLYIYKVLKAFECC